MLLSERLCFSCIISWSTHSYFSLAHVYAAVFCFSSCALWTKCCLFLRADSSSGAHGADPTHRHLLSGEQTFRSAGLLQVPAAHRGAIPGRPEQPGRCDLCERLRLLRSAAEELCLCVRCVRRVRRRCWFCWSRSWSSEEMWRVWCVLCWWTSPLLTATTTSKPKPWRWVCADLALRKHAGPMHCLSKKK